MPKGIIEQMQAKTGIRGKKRRKGKSAVSRKPNASFNAIMSNDNPLGGAKGGGISNNIGNDVFGGAPRSKPKKRQKAKRRR